MKRAMCPLIRVFGTLAAVIVAAAPAAAQNTPRNPTSKIFVAEVTGESHIDTGEKIVPLVKNGVHTPEGSVIETKANSTDALVLSNGTAMFVAPETRFEVKKFLQEPFAPNRTELDVEPSISQTFIRVAHGAIGVCTSKLVAGSSMVYQTPQATINVRGRRLMIETRANQTVVSLLEGDVTVIGDGLAGGTSLQPGLQAIIRKESPDAPAVVTIQPIPEADFAKLDETVSLACISRRTVFFESVEDPAGSGNTEIEPVRTSPAESPTQFTVSPARIDS
jgi:hypothetical protein